MARDYMSVRQTKTPGQTPARAVFDRRSDRVFGLAFHHGVNDAVVFEKDHHIRVFPA